MPENDLKRTWRISKRLKEARAVIQPKLSQSELARRAKKSGAPEITPAITSRLELGYAYATWPEVQALAAALEVTPEWLAELPDGKPPATKPAAPPLKAEVAPKSAIKSKGNTTRGRPAKPKAESASVESNEEAAPSEVYVQVPAPLPSPTAPSPAAEAVPVAAPVAVIEPTAAPAAAPLGMAAASSRNPESTPVAPPAPIVLSLSVPERAGRAATEYRSHLVAEKARGEKAMLQSGVPAAEWRQWRVYVKDLTDALRNLRD